MPGHSRDANAMRAMRAQAHKRDANENRVLTAPSQPTQFPLKQPTKNQDQSASSVEHVTVISHETRFEVEAGEREREERRERER